MGKQAKSRRERAQERQHYGEPTRSAPAPTSAPETGPERLLAKYAAQPIADLPGEAKKFHLRVITDILAGHDRCNKPVGPMWATQTWHKHHDGLASARPGALSFGGTELRLACEPGCNHCCRTPVAVVAAEAVLVAHFVARTFSADDRLALNRRIAERNAALQRDETRPYPLCPFNVAGQCTVYEVRPFNCRLFHSFDVGACERLLIGGEQHARIPIDPVRRQYDGLIVASADVAFKALKLDTRMIEFIAALEVALAAGDARCERLAAGEDLFAELPTITPAVNLRDS